MTDFFKPGRPAEFPIRRRTWDVFISHSQGDGGIARDLAQELETRGFSTWVDAKLKTGEPLRVIDEALHSCAVVIVLLSKSSLSSTWLSREVHAALKALPSDRVFPVAVGELDVRSLPPWLANRRYMHLRNRSRTRKLVEQLLPALQTAIGGPRNALGGAPVIGDLPLRQPVVGVDSYLRQLLATRTGVTWIVGMAGMGKTSLAREYVHQVRDDVAFILWLRAFAHGGTDIDEELRVVDELPPSGEQRPGLVVVDGLDELGDEPGAIVERLGATGAQNRVLITTRRLTDTRLLPAYQHSVLAVGPLPRAAVDDYLDMHVPDLSDHDRTQLAEAAGGSPLMLRLFTQALKTTSLGDLLNPPGPPGATLARSMAALLRLLAPGQRHRLEVLAFCSSLLTTIRSSEQWRLPGDDDLFDRLLQWGVVDAGADETISAHPIVVAFLRQRAPRAALEDAISYVSERLPDPGDVRSLDLLPSIVELTEVAELDWSPAVSAGLAELLIWQASTWRSAGDYERAELLCPRAIELAVESEKPLLRVRALNLQSALAFDRGRVAEASEIERRTVELASSTFGPEHPLTTASLANLAVSLRALGDLPEAITLLRRVVEQNERSLPSEHGDVIASQINLAICLREAGLTSEALDLLSTAPMQLDDPPQTGPRRARVLAATLIDAGRAEEALTVLRAALARVEDALPPDSIEVLLTRANLAMVCARLGRFDEALTLQTDAMDRFELAFGPSHPSTITARSNRAVLLAQLGMTEESLQIFLEVVNSRKQILGPDHPDALHSQLLAARALRDAGRDERAFDMYAELVGRVIRTLGPEHAMSLTVREELAQQLGRLGNARGAQLAYRELLADLDRVLPLDHPMVQRVRASAAGLA
ncbi:tetratricopeptide repeat protein [Micromonospora sp. NPDC049900]|uniref:tetratricopeptide repeat protein n=1 Tax=Micromonospora sp. NPDC049900 TaxID=3364275 RepID=UPI0037ACDB21